MTEMTPGRFAHELAERFGPPPDPLNPFNDRTKTAKQRLCMQALAEVFGPKHPISIFIKAYEKAEINTFPCNRTAEDADLVEECIETMRSSFEIIEQDLLTEVETFK